MEIYLEELFEMYSEEECCEEINSITYEAMLHTFNSVPVLPFFLHFMLPEKRSRLSPEVARCIRVENPYVTLLPIPEPS